MVDVLIDRIYEAAAAPERWPDVLDAIGTYAGSRGSVLMVVPPAGAPRWIASRAVAESVRSRVETGTWCAGRRSALCRTATLASFVGDIDLIPAAVEGEPCRADGLVWPVGTAIALPSGETAVVTLSRDAVAGANETGVLPRLNALRPHLARSCQLAARLGRERAAATATALDLIGFPAAVLTTAGRTLGANGRLQSMRNVLTGPSHDGVAFRDLVVNKRVQDAIRAAAAGGGGTRSIPVRAGAEHGAFIVHVVPVSAPPGDVFNPAAALLVMTPVCAPNAPDNDVLHVLFDLTPAESRLLRALAGGSRLQSYADGAGVRASTARSQLASIFSKTGTSRQVELLGIVASISVLAAQSAYC